MKSEVIFLLLFRHFYCLISNPAIGILTKSNLYVAQIIEFNSTIDDFDRIYHHDDLVYPLQSFTSNNLAQRVYLCSPSTIYSLDLHRGARIVSLVPIDDIPCRSSLTYLPSETTLLWALRQAIIHFDFSHMSREYLWNSTVLMINNLIYNETMENNSISFYLNIKNTNSQSSILHCRSTRQSQISPYHSCSFIDNGYSDISALAIKQNLLYVADRIEQKIYVLTLTSNHSVLIKTSLPLNTSTVADIQSMCIYDYYLIWLTASGHVRIVSLETYRVRNLFWFDEQLRTIGLLSYSQWLNRTTTSITTSTNKQIDNTTRIEFNPWKATAYIISIFLGFTLFLSAILIAFVSLHYRFERTTTPKSFTNIFHCRIITTPQPLSNEPLT